VNGMPLCVIHLIAVLGKKGENIWLGGDGGWGGGWVVGVGGPLIYEVW
jgi:hypothetical protein